MAKSQNSQPAAHLAPLLTRIEENSMRKLLVQDKDREVGYHLLSRAKNLHLGKMNLLAFKANSFK